MNILLNMFKLAKKQLPSRGPYSKITKYRELWNNIKLFHYLYKIENKYINTSLLKVHKIKNKVFLEEIVINYTNKTIIIPKIIFKIINISKKEIILVHLTGINKNSLHSNILIFDKIYKTIARIEPHGSYPILYPYNIYKSLLQPYFKDYTILPLSINNTKPGLQEVSNSYTGLCITWCIFLSNIYIRLYNYYNLFHVLYLLKYFSLFLIKYKNMIQLTIIILQYNSYLIKSLTF